MTNNTSGINKEFKVNGQKLKTVTNVKYLGSNVFDEGSMPEILSRIAQMTAALARLKPVWNNRSISLRSKLWLMCSFVTAICLYVCESWDLTAELQRREYEPWKWGVSTKDTMHLIQRLWYQWESLCQDPSGSWTTWRPPYHGKEMPTEVVWIGLLFISCCQNHHCKASERGRVKGGGIQGRQKKRWEDIKEWTGLEFAKPQRAVENREKWRKLVVKSFVQPQLSL